MRAFQVALVVKNLLANARDANSWEGGVDPGIEPVSRILACKNPMDRGA